ncbi:MAG: hypothetical protein KKG04_04195 [Candidatus Thermoplasmatota archaeon]|nr:hypothetical protein [Candidatus Thermoplasmatota archaeon]
MFDTSIDVMYGIISLCIIVFTGFLAWMMFYVVQILKQGNEVIKEVRQKIVEFEEALTSIREKVISSATSISFIASQIGTVVDVVKKSKTKGKEKKK